jgi:hypothetical protein
LELSVSGHLEAWGIIQARKRAANEKVRVRMEPELTKGLLESVEFATDILAQHAATLRESHESPATEEWDSRELHIEHMKCLTVCFRLECFAMSLAKVLRRDERQDAVAFGN